MISLTCCFVFLPSLVTTTSTYNPRPPWGGRVFPRSLCLVLVLQISSHPVQRIGQEYQGQREGTHRRHRMEAPSPFGSNSVSLSGLCAPQGEADFPLAAGRSLN